MSQYQRLLLIADPTMRHTAALQRAAALAQASGAALHIAAFIEPLSRYDNNFQELPPESQLAEHRQWLQQQATRLSSKGIKVTTEAIFSNEPLTEILLHVAQMQPDVLIKDVQPESALKRAFITPLDWHLLRECPVPVHLVSTAEQPLPRKVVAAVDLSSPETQIAGINEQIIRAANGLALQCDAELHLLHVYDLSPIILWDGAAGAAAWSADFVEELRNALLTAFTVLADSYGVPPERRHFVRGSPLKAIAGFAVRNQTDVLVMGTQHRHGLSTLIGSTAEYILYQAPCNILAIKPLGSAG
jgi:universal stress protein E